MPTPLSPTKLLQALRPKFPRLPQHSFTDEQISPRALQIWQERTAKGQSRTAEDDWQQAIAVLKEEKRIRGKAHQLWESRQLKLRESDKRTAEDDWRDAEKRLKESRWTQFVRWTGIQEKKGWDLMTGLSIPLFLFGGGTLFTYWNNQQQQQIADSRQKDEVLKNYFDSMKGLLLDKDHPLKDEQKGKDARLVARTLTLTALRQLNPNQGEMAHALNQRKRLIIQFLSESELIQGSQTKADQLQSPLIDLKDADLHDADLNRANLRKVRLEGAVINGADLKFAIFFDADLLNADLRGADLQGADLRRANLLGADLRRANLLGADLRSVYLAYTDINGANLTLAMPKC